MKNNNTYKIISIAILLTLVIIATFLSQLIIVLPISCIIIAYLFLGKYSWISFLVYPLLTILGFIPFSISTIFYIVIALIARQHLIGNSKTFIKAPHEIANNFQMYFIILLFVNLIIVFITSGFNINFLLSPLIIFSIILSASRWVGLLMISNLYYDGVYSLYVLFSFLLVITLYPILKIGFNLQFIYIIVSILIPFILVGVLHYTHRDIS